MAHLKKDEIIFAQKPQPDYSGIPEREPKKYTTSTTHVLRGLSEHDQKVYDLEQAARMRNFDKIDQMEAEAQKEGKAIVWYCCEFVRDILEGAINRGIRPDDFWHSFVPSFAGKENHRVWKKEMGFKEPPNHQYSGYMCEGNYFMMFDESHVAKFKEGVKQHLEKLETENLRLYYLESLTNDIQNSKSILAFEGRDKYNREIQPLNLWIEKEADAIKGKLSGVAPIISEPKKAGRKPAPPRTFLSLFKGESEMKRLLDAAASIGLIVADGERYTWPDEGNKSHRIRAFWYAAVDAGFKGKVKNKEAIAKTIKEFFGMESLAKDTLVNENPNNEIYKSTKAALEKRLKVQ